MFKFIYYKSHNDEFKTVYFILVMTREDKRLSYAPVHSLTMGQ